MSTPAVYMIHTRGVQRYPAEGLMNDFRPEVTILVPLWFSIISFVFFYLGTIFTLPSIEK